MSGGFAATYVVGPVAALLPKRWRQRLPIGEGVRWERATTLSGLCEMLAALVGLGYWYLSAMPEMFRIAFDAATRGNSGSSLTDFHVRGAAWVLFMLQPLTWLLFYFFAEGAVRFCGAEFGTARWEFSRCGSWITFWFGDCRKARTGKRRMRERVKRRF